MRKLVAAPAQKGFALVVTFSLMILLTVIAVVLLTMSGISLRTSTGPLDLARASVTSRAGILDENHPHVPAGFCFSTAGESPSLRLHRHPRDGTHAHPRFPGFPREIPGREEFAMFYGLLDPNPEYHRKHGAGVRVRVVAHFMPDD